MSPRTGRPPKDDAKKERMSLRLHEDTLASLQKCADMLDISKTEVIERGIKLVEAQLKKE